MHGAPAEACTVSRAARGTAAEPTRYAGREQRVAGRQERAGSQDTAEPRPKQLHGDSVK